MEWLTAIVDLLIGIAWPAAVTAIALVYKSEIPSLLRRLRKAGPAGVELDSAEQQQRARLENATSPGTLEIKQIPGIGRTPAIENKERLILSILDKIPEDERVSRLTRTLAESDLSVTFERIYRIIFHSQISMLRKLNASSHFTTNQARPFFDLGKEQFPKLYTGYTFEKWLGFLKDFQLISQDETLLSITDIGIDFLTYLTVRRIPEKIIG